MPGFSSPSGSARRAGGRDRPICSNLRRGELAIEPSVVRNGDRFARRRRFRPTSSGRRWKSPSFSSGRQADPGVRGGVDRPPRGIEFRSPGGTSYINGKIARKSLSGSRRSGSWCTTRCMSGVTPIRVPRFVFTGAGPGRGDSACAGGLKGRS